MDIKCPSCGTAIKIDQALQEQIQSDVLTSVTEQHRHEIEQLKKETSDAAKKDFDSKLTAEIEKLNIVKEDEYNRLKSKLERETLRQSEKQQELIEQLKQDASDSKEDNKELREQLKQLMQDLRSEKNAREKAELDAQKRINDELDKIRIDARKDADELHRQKQQELEKQLENTRKALDEATRKAEQGSEQIQGEVLELEIEAILRAEFPTDQILEVKKGQRGADIKQVVYNNRAEECGLILWETKNAKWNRDWINKLKADVREANANMGVLVSRDIPDELNDITNIEGYIWLVKPKFVTSIATAIRTGIIQVYSAARNAENKDEKMEILYKFLTGTEFRHRIEAIVENYNQLQQEIEKEKRAAQRRWALQEKSIAAVIGNTYGLYGDLQGIAGAELQIPLLEASDE